MLRPAVNQIISKNESCYSLVIAVAKRARQISEELYENGETLEEKPVKTAVEEIASGKCKIISPAPEKLSE
ncbi:MAG: DNA-directed RNA polymerase subunit omega [Ruminococcus sp.]|jgi:DNA-directed RNA polymerase subunit omega|nr:DNA-directed RNA polymerase subunit omega [Ruminococcus sp.]